MLTIRNLSAHTSIDASSDASSDAPVGNNDGTLADFLHFFDHVAFADNPKWASCYCHFPHADHANVDWKQRGAAENRAATCALANSGGMRGLLAYADGQVVGWCNAGPRPLIDNMLGEVDPEGERIGAIACFVVAPDWRRRGVARALLDAACDGFAAQGLAWAEAYPLADAASAAALHHGPIEMYLGAGFKTVREDDGTLCMRKRLSAKV